MRVPARGELLEPDRGNLFVAKKLRGIDSPVTGDDRVMCIDQYWVRETKGTDTARDLPNLCFRMRSSISFVRIELRDIPIGYGHHPTPHRNIRTTGSCGHTEGEARVAGGAEICKYSGSLVSTGFIAAR